MIEAGTRLPSHKVATRMADAVGVPALALYMLAADEDDVPKGKIGMEIIGRIASLADDLCRYSRRSSRNGRNGNAGSRS
jgi:hypothetical protein